jgi:hypothetical protein
LQYCIKHQYNDKSLKLSKDDDEIKINFQLGSIFDIFRSAGGLHGNATRDVFCPLRFRPAGRLGYRLGRDRRAVFFGGGWAIAGQTGRKSQGDDMHGVGFKNIGAVVALWSLAADLP